MWINRDQGEQEIESEFTQSSSDMEACTSKKKDCSLSCVLLINHGTSVCDKINMNLDV